MPESRRNEGNAAPGPGFLGMPARAYAIPAIAMAVGMLSASVLAVYIWHMADLKGEDRFRYQVRQTREAIEKRFDMYTAQLGATAGLLTAKPGLSAEHFAEYIGHIGLAERYPGMKGIGFAERICPADVLSLDEAFPLEHPESRKLGDNALLPVKFLEPDPGHPSVAGFDLQSIPAWREAMIKAQDTGRPAASSKGCWPPSAGEGRRGRDLLLLFMPVYRGWPESAEERRDALAGFVFTPIAPDEMLRSMFRNPEAELLQFTAYDGLATAGEAAFFTVRTPENAAAAKYASLQTISAAGRTWTLHFESTPEFESGVDYAGGWYVLIFGTLISLFLSRLTWVQARARVHAERSREALRESEARFRNMADSAPVMIWMTGPSGESVYCNQQWNAYIGDDSADAGRGAWAASLHPEDAAAVRARFAEAAAAQEGFRIDYRLRRHDGEFRWMADSATPRHGAGGEFLGFIGSMVDITELKEAEQTLKALNEMLEQRVAERTAEAEQRAAELRRLAAELTHAEQRERRRIAQILHDEVQQLLAAAKMRVSSLRHQRGQDALEQTVSEANALLSEVIQKARSLSIDLSPPMLHDRGLGHALEWLARRTEQELGLDAAVCADYAITPEDEATGMFLLQAVRELLFNVLKHSGVREARVVMEAAPEGRVRIRVEDDGEGFDPGACLDAAPDGDASFGLFSIKHRLALMGGRLEIRSAPGQGTRVMLEAPLRDPKAAGNGGSAPARGENGGAAPPGEPAAETPRIRVLLADDHKIVRQGLAILLESAPGLELAGEASDGRAAVEMARALRPDVVVLDVSMPEMNGIEAARVIHEELPGIRIIGLSMHEAEDMAAAMRDAGAEAYLSKDGPSETLLAAIRGLAPAGMSAAVRGRVP